MNEVQIFDNPEFGNVRTLTDEHEQIWFCGKDVCKCLGYFDGRKAIKDHCDSKGVSKRNTPTEGGNQQMTFINEPNLYRLVTHSKLPKAQEFERWIFEEVLPTIRKTGKYEMNLKATRKITTDDYMDAARTIAKCHNSRLPIVIDLYKKAGLDVLKLEVKAQQIEDNHKEIADMMKEYSLSELQVKFPDISKSSLYYYMTGQHVPKRERRELIIKVLMGGDEDE